MSDRECNYCLYQYILNKAEKTGDVITTSKDKKGGTDVYINGEWHCWFMRLPTSCAC